MTRHTSGEPADPRDGLPARWVDDPTLFGGHVQPPDSSTGPMSVTLLGGRAAPAHHPARPPAAPPAPPVPPPGGPEPITWLDHPSGPLPAAPPIDPADISAVVDSVVHGLLHEAVRPAGTTSGAGAPVLGPQHGPELGSVTGAWYASLPGEAEPLASTGPYAYPPPAGPSTPPEPRHYTESADYGEPAHYIEPAHYGELTQYTGSAHYGEPTQYTGSAYHGEPTQNLGSGQYLGSAAQLEYRYDADGRGYPAQPADAGPTAAAFAQITPVEPADPVVSAAASGMASSAAPIPYATEEAAPMVYAPRGRSYPQGLRRRRGRRAPGAQRIVSVDNNRCHLYAICQMEAPATFELGRDGRLHYDMAPPGELLGEVRQAARLCPMQAIKIRED